MEEKNKIHRHRSTVICLHQNKILGFQAEDPTSHKKYFFLPGGKIEPGESARESAVRECLEETGYKIHLQENFKTEKIYDFFWDGQLYLSQTEFFAATLVDPEQRPPPVQDASYHQGVLWIAKEELEKYFSYQKEILAAVKEALEFLEKSNGL